MIVLTGETTRTPVANPHLQKHFGELFQKQLTPKAKARAKPPFSVKLAYYGKVLTSDEDENRLIRAQQVPKPKDKAKKTQGKTLTARRKRVA